MLAINDVKNCYYRIENFWERREKFCKINPTAEVPVLAIQNTGLDDKKSMVLWGQNTIMDYLRNEYPVHTLVSVDVNERAKIMKYNEFFDTKFYADVTKPILEERVYVSYKKKRLPNHETVRLARMNLEEHLKFIDGILRKREHIATAFFSLADLSLASQISSLDYLGEINWSIHPELKEWYILIKSKPAFRDILYDIIPDFRPSIWYRELDF